MSAIPVTDPDELELARTILKRIDQGPQIINTFATALRRGPAPGSDLFLDDTATAWMQSSHVITAALTMATDNIRAVGEMLRPADRLQVPLYAHYPVLRSILEASALAKWLLVPEDPTERISRALRTRYSDAVEDDSLKKEERALFAAMDNGPGADAIAVEQERAKGRHARDVAKIRSIADAHEIPWAQIKPGRAPWIHIIRAVCTIDEAPGLVRVPGNYAAHLWKVMSGLSHPSLSRAVNHSDTTRLPGHSPDGIFHAQLTPSFRWTTEAITLAWNTTNEAVQLLGQRQLTRFHR